MNRLLKELFAVIFIVLFLFTFSSLTSANSSVTKGEIEVIIGDKIGLNEEGVPIMTDSKTEYFLRRGVDKIPLKLPFDFPPPRPGQKARILPNGALKYFGPKLMLTKATVGEKKMAVALIKPFGENPSKNKQNVEDTLETAKEFLESSGQHSKITVYISSTEDWEESEKTIDDYYSDDSSFGMNLDLMLKDAIKAVDGTVNFKEIDCLFIIISDESRPFHWSMATVGENLSSDTDDGVCNFGVVWMGLRNFKYKNLPSHESLHVLLGESHGAGAETTNNNDNCYNLGETNEYSDLFDVMGSGLNF